MAHTEIGFDVMKRAVADLAGMGHPDSEPKLIGRNINVMLTPLPENKRKPKYYSPEAPEDIVDEVFSDDDDVQESGGDKAPSGSSPAA
jgi:translation initiation factor IF-3